MTVEFCFIDIETAPMESFHWSAKTDYIPHDFNSQETTILCASWKFSGEMGVKNTSIHHKHKRLTYKSTRKDRRVVKDIINLLMLCADKNIIVVGQNGDRFDLPKIRCRGIIHRLPPIPKLTTVDTLKESRKLGFDYNRLDYKDRLLHGKGKVETRGWPMWRDVVHRDSTHEQRLQAMKEMVHYCDGDILSLERDFNTLRPYMLAFPNMNLWQGSQMHCPQCGGDNIIYRSKPRPVQTRLQRRMSCKDCGRWFEEIGAMKDEYGKVIKALVK